MGKKKMKKVVPFAVMTTMLLSATLPAFAASRFVFEDWDFGVISEKEETESGTLGVGQTREEKRSLKAASPAQVGDLWQDKIWKATPSEVPLSKTAAATPSEVSFSQTAAATPSQLGLPRAGVSASLGNLWENWDVADLSFN